jgi:hypothetical protein
MTARIRIKKPARPANPPMASLGARREALRVLEGYHTHDALTGEEAKRIAAPFGLHHEGYELTCNTRDPKGLFVPGLPANAKVRRVGMYDLAEDIARHLQLQYPSKMGRGFQARVCCEAIADALDTEEAAGRWAVEYTLAGDHEPRSEFVHAVTGGEARAAFLAKGYAEPTVIAVRPAPEVA